MKNQHCCKDKIKRDTKPPSWWDMAIRKKLQSQNVRALT
jgi:hypothetical protein